MLWPLGAPAVKFLSGCIQLEWRHAEGPQSQHNVNDKVTHAHIFFDNFDLRQSISTNKTLKCLFLLWYEMLCGNILEGDTESENNNVLKGQNKSVEFLLLAVFQVWRAAVLAGQSEDRNLMLWAWPVSETGWDLHFHRLPSRGQWRRGTRLTPFQ